MIFNQLDFQIQPTRTSPAPTDVLLLFQEGRALLGCGNDGFFLPTLQQLTPLLPSGWELFELARVSGVGLYTAHPFKRFPIPEPEGYSLQPIGVMRTLPYATAAKLTTCWHLWSWYQTHRFCGSCGAPTEPDGTERALRCAACGHVTYPVISPAVIVAITCGDRILLARSARNPRGTYALVAGYVEAGETLEQTVRREVLEEVGIRLSSVRYLGNQPWGLSGSHMFAFHAEADDTQPIRIQESELSDARWFDREALPERPNPVSIAYELIERFRRHEL